jgi:hypothetical protein
MLGVSRWVGHAKDRTGESVLVKLRVLAESQDKSRLLAATAARILRR